ncbi:MAG: hypothetical protein K2X86_00740 [Cytophagaceae bacterium]|nr:hypothetical protein [Cytophagaceae bacterium]
MIKEIFSATIATLFMDHSFIKEKQMIHNEEVKPNLSKISIIGAEKKCIIHSAYRRILPDKTKPGPRHKGRFQQAGDYFIEMVKDNNKLIFYLYDKDGNAINNNSAEGSIQIFYEGKQRATEKLITESSDKFTVILKEYYLKCIVSFEAEGKIAKAKFKRKQKNTRTPGIKTPKPMPSNDNHGGHTH